MHFARLSICNKITVVVFISRAELLGNKPRGGGTGRAKLLQVSRALPGQRLALGSVLGSALGSVLGSVLGSALGSVLGSASAPAPPTLSPLLVLLRAWPRSSFCSRKSKVCKVAEYIFQWEIHLWQHFKQISPKKVQINCYLSRSYWSTF